MATFDWVSGYCSRTIVASPGGPTLFYSRPIECVAFLGWELRADKSLSQRNFLVRELTGADRIPRYRATRGSIGTAVLLY